MHILLSQPEFHVHGPHRGAVGVGGLLAGLWAKCDARDRYPELPGTQVNIILSDHNVDKAIETICQAAQTGSPGDGIFVYPVEDVIRIRTGERGRAALQYADDIDARREATASPAGANP